MSHLGSWKRLWLTHSKAYAFLGSFLKNKSKPKHKPTPSHFAHSGNLLSCLKSYDSLESI